MKMTSEDFDTLSKMIVPLDTAEKRQQYLTGQFPRSAFVKDLNKRYRWGLLFQAGGRLHDGNFLSNLYKYLNDSHINTALMKLVPPLQS